MIRYCSWHCRYEVMHVRRPCGCCPQLAFRSAGSSSSGMDCAILQANVSILYSTHIIQNKVPYISNAVFCVMMRAASAAKTLFFSYCRMSASHFFITGDVYYKQTHNIHTLVSFARQPYMPAFRMHTCPKKFLAAPSSVCLRHSKTYLQSK